MGELADESKLLLFLSADLEGATARKHKFRNYVKGGWQSALPNYLEKFASLLGAGYAVSNREHERTNASPIEIWKALGDELIFKMELRSRMDLLCGLKCFKQAIIDHNLKVQDDRVHRDEKPASDPGLLIKGSAWVAGFPVTNMVINWGDVFRPEADAPKASNLPVDYIGPSMDLGFRISKHATPERLVISVEVAWLLSVFEWDMRIYYGGRIPLKGIAEKAGYPLLWSPSHRSTFQTYEDDRTGRQPLPNERGKDLYQAYIEEHGTPNFTPFLPNEKDTPRPPKYAEWLKMENEQRRKDKFSPEPPQSEEQTRPINPDDLLGDLPKIVPDEPPAI